jgi:activator of HSP90 ATPase
MSHIHQEIVLNAPPQRVYDALTSSKHFSALSGGAPTEIGNQSGSAFSCFGGMITGRNVELLENRRIVQAWRAKTWEEGRYSITRFELKQDGQGTRLIFDHDGFPADQKEHLEKGWEANYWAPLRKYLG